MKKLLERLLVFAIGLPLVVVILLALPQFNHLAFSVAVIIVSAIGAVELGKLLAPKNLPIGSASAAVLGSFVPVSTMLVSNFGLPRQLLWAVFCAGICWVLSSNIFRSKEKLDSYTNRVAAGLVVLVYPGTLISWIIALMVFPGAEIVILNFLLITLMNDSLAWVFGMLFGKNNRGFVAASPNKSIAGFAGGLFASITIGIVAAYFFPDAFPPVILPWYIAGGLLGLCSGVAVVFGDLAESCFKRSVGVKDSGRVIPGRGGMLDCIDSLSLAAPVYYFLFRFFFTVGV